MSIAYIGSKCCKVLLGEGSEGKGYHNDEEKYVTKIARKSRKNFKM